MKFSLEAERQFCCVCDRLRTTSSAVRNGKSTKIMVQLEVEVGDSPDTTTITQVLPLVRRNYDGTITLIGHIARNDGFVGISMPKELSPPQTCGEQYNNP